MKPLSLIDSIKNGALDTRLSSLYGEEALVYQRMRYIDLIDDFAARYGQEREVSLFSVPGRSELSGNHTDHNHGRVIAASIDLDVIAVASPTDGASGIRIKSAGFDEDTVDPALFSAPDKTRFGHSDALIAGVTAGFIARGYNIGGFDACTTSNVLKGSGLSSSAAFEDMTGLILSHFYNGGSVGYVTIAQISQYAENAFFGKPCGLMDQVACAAGGIVAIDFADPVSPVVDKLGFDLTAAGYRLCIVNTGGNHADLTDDYAAVPAEMKAAAAHFGAKVLRDVPEDGFIAAIPALRAEVGDRAVLRGLHFYAENRRVGEQKNALDEGNLDAFLTGVRESGRSSFCYLQNVYTTKNVAEQGLSLALCLSERYIAGCRRPGACRVHGGGFAGTVQAFIPAEDAVGYRDALDAAFGAGSCHMLRVRAEGGVRLA